MQKNTKIIISFCMNYWKSLERWRKNKTLVLKKTKPIKSVNETTTLVCMCLMVCSISRKLLKKSFHLFFGWLAHDTHLCSNCFTWLVNHRLYLILSMSRSPALFVSNLYVCVNAAVVVVFVYVFLTFNLVFNFVVIVDDDDDDDDVKQMNFVYKFNAVLLSKTLNCNNRGNFWEKPKIRLNVSIKMKTVLRVHKIYSFLLQ